jgi:hypothetical protein
MVKTLMAGDDGDDDASDNVGEGGTAKKPKQQLSNLKRGHYSSAV